MSGRRMRIMVVGKVGREHALAWRLAQSGSRPEVLATAGNPGMRGVATPLEGVDPQDPRSLLAAAQRSAVDLVVFGGEEPLAMGAADMMREAGIAAFGPGAQAARLEGSKQWAKEFMQEFGIPTAEFKAFGAPEEAAAHCETLPDGSYVIKADGLCAGKGVALPASGAEARAELMRMAAAGSAYSTVLVEERLTGYEVSVFAFIADGHLAGMTAACDYKRALDGDDGPNTGGMGCYAVPEVFGRGLAERAEREVIRPAMEGLQRRGLSYRGVLYAGLMVTPEGPKVLEFNVRFGDPECQVLMTLLDGDFAALCDAIAAGDAAGAELRWHEGRHGVGVVMAAAGYPGRSEAGAPIGGLEAAGELAQVFHAGTRAAQDGGVEAAGGRALTLVGNGASLEEARANAYAAVGKVTFPQAHYRRDIALAKRGEQ